MKSLKFILAFSFTLALLSCKSTSKNPSGASGLEDTINEKNRSSVTLLNRIQKLPGISLRNGLPALGKGNNSIESNGEPLYILDGYVVGNSFRSVDELVTSQDVQKVVLLKGSDASFYGSRAGSGVIKITTYK